ncbi:hypothetical protein A2911_02700 [Candidatus Nomurabacteria bacterium RIFCSPLOWO2_01_FULL_40_15]|uniref:Uncharacterized protein n=1 Tax=Candidatus Nomurabacteria bacterium RIFCSPLOWO2_01_FULL_40_15 TaxID=1801772 RepID=A0A1F6X699_9BACT|nr:MAG: hypothetical protein A2911_02700 [Candidatus Nomurabacteria bacterium RIFCSPLOWO2_01_FULL_40_15]
MESFKKNPEENRLNPAILRQLIEKSDDLSATNVVRRVLDALGAGNHAKALAILKWEADKTLQSEEIYNYFRTFLDNK